MEEPEDDIEPSLADDQEFDDAVSSPEGVRFPADETTDATTPADAPENEDANWTMP